MDKNHEIDAPNNDSLRSVEQLEDHSALSSLYPHKNTDWTGDLVSAEDRATKRDQATLHITTSIRRSSVAIGILAPLPFLLAGLIIATLQVYGMGRSTKPEDTSFYAIVTILGGMIWLALSLYILHKIGEIFYKHALRATPFVLVLLALLSASIQALYVFTLPIHQAQPLMAVGIVGGATLVWSVFLCSALLWLWTAPQLAAHTKFTVIAGLAIVLIAVATTASLLII